MLQGLEIEENQKPKTTKPKDFSYSVEYFLKKKSQMDNAFNQIKPDLQELSEFFSPRNCRFLVDDVNKPLKKSKRIIDSITLTAVRNFASGMQSGATSAATRWFKFQMKKKELNDIHSVKIWCNQQEELIRRILAVSNFYQSMLGIYKHLSVYSFGALSMESDYQTVVNFKLLPIGSYRYSKDHRGNIDTVCRTFKESAKNIVEKFGYDNCPDNVKGAYDGNNDTLFTLCYFVEPNKEYNPKSPLARNKKYISATFVVGQDKFLKLSGFDRFPFAIFEADVNGEDIYPSNCPGIEALPDAKQLMVQVKEYAKGLKKLVSPLYKGPASLVKEKGITDAPGQVIAETDDGRGISTVYEVPPDVLKLKQNNDELKQTIKEHFYNDLFAVILNTAERGRTATEVNEIKEEKMVLLSPLLDQVHKGLRSILDWIFFETVETGIMAEPPEEIQAEEMETEFVSALALAQKVKNISGIERFTTFVTNLSQACDPTLVKKINADMVVDKYVEIANVNPELVVPTDEVNKYREQLQQQQQQAQQMQQVKEGTEMIKNMGGIDSIGGDLATRLGVG
jgi:hypothetical protein|nr:MAG TPA: head to tail connecting protein [Caudoviricetes sp.]